MWKGLAKFCNGSKFWVGIALTVAAHTFREEERRTQQLCGKLQHSVSN